MNKENPLKKRSRKDDIQGKLWIKFKELREKGYAYSYNSLLDDAMDEVAKAIFEKIEEKIQRKSYRLSCVNEDLEGEVIDISELKKILEQIKKDCGD